jgi:hypothetical protein
MNWAEEVCDLIEKRRARGRWNDEFRAKAAAMLRAKDIRGLERAIAEQEA